MNTGVRDAVNLARKLAFCLHGVATDRLPASYRAQRFAAVSGVLRSTDHDTGLIAGLVPRNHIDGVYFPEFATVTTIVTSCRCSTPVSPRRRRRTRTAWQGTMFPGTFCLAAGDVSQQL